MGQGDRVPSPRVRAYGDEGRRGHRRIRCSATDAREEREAPSQPGDAEDQENQANPMDERGPRRHPEQTIDRKSNPGNPDIEEDEESDHLRPGQDPLHPPPETSPRIRGILDTLTGPARVPAANP